jgi:hypothetical protein
LVVVVVVGFLVGVEVCVEVVVGFLVGVEVVDEAALESSLRTESGLNSRSFGSTI